jgi:acetyl esterase/lipase
MPFKLDSEVAVAFAALMPGGRLPPAAVGDVEARRARTDAMMSLVQTMLPSHDDVKKEDFHAKTSDGHDLLLRWYIKTGTPKDSPAVLYMHGGGMIAMGIGHYDKGLQNYVHATGVPFLAVEFRNAPEFPAPFQVSDSYAGLIWLHDNASKLGVDVTRIALCGDSGGGGIAAALAHYSLNRNGPKIAKQILIYPMLDDRNTVPDENLVPFATWGYVDSETGWGAVLGARRGKDGVSPEESAARMTVEEAKRLPEAYIDVGELDIFRDEDIEYARKLTLAGVSTELHVYPGVPHAWELFTPGAQVSKRAIANRMLAIQSIESV